MGDETDIDRPKTLHILQDTPPRPPSLKVKKSTKDKDKKTSVSMQYLYGLACACVLLKLYLQLTLILKLLPIPIGFYLGKKLVNQLGLIDKVGSCWKCNSALDKKMFSFR